MLKIVLDSNIIASATIKKESPPGKIFEAWQKGRVHLVISPPILEEVGRVLFYDKIRKYSWMTEEEIEKIIDDLANICIPVALDLNVVKEHAADNKFVSAAVEGKAKYIVTGNYHLLNLKTYKRIKIISPADFVKILEKQA